MKNRSFSMTSSVPNGGGSLSNLLRQESQKNLRKQTTVTTTTTNNTPHNNNTHSHNHSHSIVQLSEPSALLQQLMTPSRGGPSSRPNSPLNKSLPYPSSPSPSNPNPSNPNPSSSLSPNRAPQQPSLLSTSISLPVIQSKKQSAFANTLKLYNQPQDEVYSRLSGLVENVNSSGLFSDRVSPMRPLSLCVRCSKHASLCMACAEEDCVRTVTFYRKTRAAGAATLFTKAFVEAGNTKVIKFIAFRLMKNSFQARKRETLKKRSVVEKLFGTNLVYLPFTAWRRYTKQNIIKRKDKTITKLSDRIKHLEEILLEREMKLNKQTQEILSLQENEKELLHQIETRDSKIEELYIQLKEEQSRVIALSTLTKPIEAYSTTMNSLLQEKLIEINHYLHIAATTSIGYDYSHIFQDSVLIDMGKAANERLTLPITAGRQTTKAATNKTMASTQQILLDWANTISLTADNFIESSTGKLLSNFLPPHQPLESLNDLRNGKVLTRLVVGIIYDRTMLRKTLESRNKSQSTLQTKSWIEPRIDIDDLNEIKKQEGHTMDLITFILKIANRSLDLPVFKPLDVFSGKQTTILALAIGLLNASIPTINRTGKDAVEKFISKYYTLAEDITQLQGQQDAIRSISQISHFFNQEGDHTLRGSMDSHDSVPHVQISSNSEDRAIRLSKEEEHHQQNQSITIHHNHLQPSSAGDGNAHNHDRSLTSPAEDMVSTTAHNGINTTEKEDANQPHSADDAKQHESLLVFHPIDTSAIQLPAAMKQEVEAKVASHHLHSSSTTIATPRAYTPSSRKRKLMKTNGKQYKELCSVLDEFIKNEEDHKTLELSTKLLEISNKLSDLQTAVFSHRDAHEKGIAFTTELRQYVLNTFINSTVG